VNDLGKYGLYFFLGGSIVSFSTYLGSQGKSFLAAMASTFPAITGVTFILLYASGGGATTVDYARNLLWFVPPWTVYVVTMILHSPSRLLACNGRLAHPLYGMHRAGENGASVDTRARFSHLTRACQRVHYCVHVPMNGARL
jgi:ABC-type transport system involved in multi-copper enzyme maturation permease subunit